MRRHLAVLPLALVSTLGMSGAAHAATCASSTPTSQSFSDAAGDVETLNGTAMAPDITALRVTVDAACNLTLDYTAANPPATNDFYAYYLDIDNNAATGYTSGFTGADFVVARSPGQQPALMQLQGGSSVVIKWLTGVGNYDATVNLADVGATPGIPFRIYGGTSWKSSSGKTYSDFAPDAAQPPFSFPFAFTAALTPPPTSTTPVIPAPPTTPPVDSGSSDAAPVKAVACRVPKLKGLTLDQARRKLSAAHCRLGKTTRTKTSRRQAGRVISSTPKAGTVLGNGAKVNVRVGSRVATGRRASVSAGASRADQLAAAAAAAAAAVG